MAQAQPNTSSAMLKTLFPWGFSGAMPDMHKWIMAPPHIHATMMKAVIDQQRELFAFLGRRCDEDLKLAEKISSAGSVGELYAAYLGFCKDAASQYAAEAGKAAEISSQSTVEIVHNIQQQQKAAVDTITKTAEGKAAA